MAFELPALPYDRHALEPHLSAETLDSHYGGYHRDCIERLDALIEGTRDAGKSLEALITGADGERRHLAAEAWNHTFHWHCLAPGGGRPSGALGEAIARQYGGLEGLQAAFNDRAMAHLGAGWAWLVKEGEDALALLVTDNADTPIAHGHTPLLAIDLWEHAYFIDYRNDRLKYLEHLWALVNWDFVGQNFVDRSVVG
jgi:superoxide dismutase, Fe-Mn family